MSGVFVALACGLCLQVGGSVADMCSLMAVGLENHLGSPQKHLLDRDKVCVYRNGQQS